MNFSYADILADYSKLPTSLYFLIYARILLRFFIEIFTHKQGFFMKATISSLFLVSLITFQSIYPADFTITSEANHFPSLPPSPTSSFHCDESSDDETFKFPELPELAIRSQAKDLPKIPLLTDSDSSDDYSAELPKKHLPLIQQADVIQRIRYSNPGQDAWEQQLATQQEEVTTSTKKRRLCTWCCCNWWYKTKKD
jgi:hypothetical protein